MKLLRFLYLYLVLLIFVPVICGAQILKIVHFDVGKGDATLIISPSDSTLLVDAGSVTYGGNSAAETINAYLVEHQINSLTYTLATHFHDDHINAYTTLFDAFGYTPQIAYDRGAPGVDSTWSNFDSYDSYIDYVENASIRDSIFAGGIIDLGAGVTLTTIYSNGDFFHGRSDPMRFRHQMENVRSICLFLEYRNFRYVVAGDLTGSGGVIGNKETPCAGLIGDVDVFQVNHHGGGSSTNQSWLDVLRPEAGVVSNDDNMVNQTVVDRIDECETMETLYYTEYSPVQGGKAKIVNGNVILETNGLDYYIVDGDTFAIKVDPQVSVTASPDSSYIVIPSSGGDFGFGLEFTNNTGDTAIFDWWTLLYRQGTWRSALGAVRDTLLPYGSTAYSLGGTFPEFFDSGNYIYEARVGIYPDSVWDSSCFPIWKDTTDNGQSADGSACEIMSRAASESSTDFIPPEDPILSACPNPFNPTTVLSYRLQVASIVNLSVYDVAGKQVAELVNGWRDAGVHEVTFDGSELTSGVYLYRLDAVEYTASGKMVMMK